MKPLLICTLLLGFAIEAAAGGASPWEGTWKIDPARSHLTGDTFTYSKGPGDLLHYADGSSANFDFGLDGKEYMAWPNHTVSWTAAGENAWDSVYKVDGKITTTSHRVLAADGKTLTVTISGKRPDGSDLHDEAVYTRVSGSSGLLGTWRTVKNSGAGVPQQYVISVPQPGLLRYELPDMKASAEGRADGSDHAISSPAMPPDSSIGFKAIGAKKMRYVIKVGGKPDSYGIQTIAKDGRSFTDVSWNPGKESEKLTSVYVRQ